jgi:hypothetical protein
MIGFNYFTPVTKTWDYLGVANAAQASGYQIVALLDDGVVYTTLPQQNHGSHGVSYSPHKDNY